MKSIDPYLFILKTVVFLFFVYNCLFCERSKSKIDKVVKLFK